MFNAGVAIHEFYGDEAVAAFYEEFSTSMDQLFDYAREQGHQHIVFIGGIVSDQNGNFLSPFHGKTVQGIQIYFCQMRHLQTIDDDAIYVGCLDSYHIDKTLSCRMLFHANEYMGFDAIMQWNSHFVMTLTVQQLFALALSDFWLAEHTT